MHSIAVDGVAPARGLMRNPWLLTDIEAACKAQAAPRRPGLQTRLSRLRRADPRQPCDPIAFLHELAECGLACGVRKRGFVMELAGWLLGETNHLLAEFRQTADLADVARLLSTRLAPT